MKKLILIMALLFTVPLFSQITLSGTDSVTVASQDDRDILDIQIYNGGSFVHRQQSWRLHRLSLQSWLDDQSLTWTGINTFNGATFAAGSHGRVTFADSVQFNANLTYTQNIFPKTTAGYFNGQFGQKWLTVYSKNVFAENLYVTNVEGNDSVLISYDDSTITFNKSASFFGTVSIADDISMDSSASFNVFNFLPHPYTIPTVGDTMMTLALADLYSLIEIDLPGNVTPGISHLQVDTATKGMILKMYNGDASYSIIFEDIVSGDDNLYLTANMTLGTYDYIELLCVDATKAAQKWIEMSRSNN